MRAQQNDPRVGLTLLPAVKMATSNSWHTSSRNSFKKGRRWKAVQAPSVVR